MEKLKAQNAYLDALASNDITKLREIYSKYSSKRRSNFNETPSFDTPMTLPNDTPSGIHQSVRTNASKESSSSKKSIADNHSLDSFLSKFTSEDDQSFEEIIEAAEEKLRKKFAILYSAEDESSSLMKNSLALPPIETQFAIKRNEERINKLDTWTYKNKNYIMYIPDGVDFTQAEKIEMAKKKQEIYHNNTRLITNPFNEKQDKETISELAKTQARDPEKIGFDGNSLNQDLTNTPKIRGFSFVKSPSPCPSLIDSSPLMTWGEIEGTPFRLDGGDTPLRPSISGPSFRIAETSKREALAHELADRASEKHREKKSRAIETAKRNMHASPQVRNSLQRLASMSPAARRLTSSWGTPSPQISRSTFSTPKQIKTPIIKINTPVRPAPSDSNRSSTSSTSLTDNLLDIPSTSKRSRASDYF